jgi:hypothetical protein
LIHGGRNENLDAIQGCVEKRQQPTTAWTSYAARSFFRTMESFRSQRLTTTWYECTCTLSHIVALNPWAECLSKPDDVRPLLPSRWCATVLQQESIANEKEILLFCSHFPTLELPMARTSSRCIKRRLLLVGKLVDYRTELHPKTHSASLP